MSSCHKSTFGDPSCLSCSSIIIQFTKVTLLWKKEGQGVLKLGMQPPVLQEDATPPIQMSNQKFSVLSRLYLYAEPWLWQLVCGGLCFTIVSVPIHSRTVCIQREFIRCFCWAHYASLDVIYMLTRLGWTASVARGTGLSSYYFII